MPFVLSLSYERYRAFDPGRTLLWLLQIIKAPNALAIRGEHAFLIAHTTTPAWHPNETECHILFLCAAPGYHWQAVKLLRQSIAWARERQCVRWWFSSETPSDIGPLALRVGARASVVRYQLDL